MLAGRRHVLGWRTGNPCSAPSLSPRITAASACCATIRAPSATSVTMAFEFGIHAGQSWQDCASSTSTGPFHGLGWRSATPARRPSCGLDSRSYQIPLLARPVHEATLDREEQEIEAITERARSEDRGIHVRHCRTIAAPRTRAGQVRRVEPMNISATTTITSASDTPWRRPTKVCGSDSSSITSHSTRIRDAPITFAARIRVLRAFINAVGDV